MALQVSSGTAMMNGRMTPTSAEEDAIYTQLLHLRDQVVAGKHPKFKLSAQHIAELNETLAVPAEPEPTVQRQTNGTANISAYAANQQQSVFKPDVNGLPGLNALSPLPPVGAKPTTNGGLDPIFLEKSDSLVRAEGILKRQRIEKELQAQVERQHNVQTREEVIDVDAIFKAALERVPHVSGLKAAQEQKKQGSETSFDENDYYSSQVQSDWSPDTSSRIGSDKGVGAFVDDYEPVDNQDQGSFAGPSYVGRKRTSYGSAVYPQLDADDADEEYEPQIEDEEYTPPDAAAFDTFHHGAGSMSRNRATPAEDDNSDYEPGEITQDSAVPTPNHRIDYTSPQVPVIHNRLTHIAAPQPNRVSPLATAKGPSIELELVNGRPEVVQKHQPQPQRRSMRLQGGSPSRLSTASPPGNGMGTAGRKALSKRQRKLQIQERREQRKRKREQRDHEPQQYNKKRRDRQAGAQSPVSPAQYEPYIKDEPVSPPPFANLPQAPPYREPQYAPPHVDLSSPQYAPPVQYVQRPPESGLRYEYAPAPPPPAVVRLASPIAARPVQRDTQDLRRVASMHLAQRPPSPRRLYSPVAPYRAMSMAYGEQQEPLQLQPLPTQREAPRYQEVAPRESVQYVQTEAGPAYPDPYGTRASSPAMMAPPPPRRIVVDQFGNRYYAADSGAPPATSMRASVAPMETRQQTAPMYERAPSRATYAPTPTAAQYDPADSMMAPPPLIRRQEQPIEYVDANGYRVREYSSRPAEPLRFGEAPTPPANQSAPRYEQMPPPPLPAATPAREPTSPVYQPLPRAYSVRPEEPPQPNDSSYIRQASVAPVQYVRQDMPPPPPPPVRAVSVMPGGGEYGNQSQTLQQPMYGYAPVPAPTPQAVRYVDAYGREVYPQPQQVRQVSEFRYQ